MDEEQYQMDDVDIPESAYTSDEEVDADPVSMEDVNKMLDEIAVLTGDEVAAPTTRPTPKIFPLLPPNLQPPPSADKVACVGCKSACWQHHRQEVTKGKEIEVVDRLLSRCSITFRYEFGGKRRGVVTECSEVMQVEQTKDGGACFGCKNAMWHRVLPTEEGSSLRVYCKALHLDAYGGERKGRFELCEFRKGQGDE